MSLRCIKCNISEKREKLSDSFWCIDTEACALRQETKARLTAQTNTVCLYFDCACEHGSQAGGQALGVGIHCTINGEVQEQWCGTKFIAHGTVNTGEFTALIYALSVAILIRRQYTHYTFRIFGDSQLIVNMFNGEYRHNNFVNYYIKADMLRQQLSTSLLSCQWIPREKNQAADILSKKAITDYRALHPIN